MVIKIQGYKRFGLPEDWKESIPIDELIEHFNLLAIDAKEIHDLLSVVREAAIAKLEEKES